MRDKTVTTVTTLILTGAASLLLGWGLFNILSTDQNLAIGCLMLGGALFAILLFVDLKS